MAKPDLGVKDGPSEAPEIGGGGCPDFTGLRRHVPKGPVCMHLSLCTHICMCIYIYICTYEDTYMYIYNIYVYTRKYALHMCMCTYIHICIHIYIYIYV